LAARVQGEETKARLKGKVDPKSAVRHAQNDEVVISDGGYYRANGATTDNKKVQLGRWKRKFFKEISEGTDVNPVGI